MKIYTSILPLVLASLIISIQTAIAQTYTPSNRTPVTDGTMNTQVSGNGSNFNITGGVNRGQTLFHSFGDFSVPTNGTANFINPANARDIITRVTGNNFSDINGLINSNGANFFLINPNGVTFGTNARLNVGRAFMATSANGINLVDAGGRAITFGTNANGDAPLLSVAPNVLFNVSSLTMGGNSGQINNFGTLQTNNTSQYIGLIGGNVNFNGGQILAPGAKVELGGSIQAGEIGVNLDNELLFSNNLERGNVSLAQVGTSPSIVDIDSTVGGGKVKVFAKNINIEGKGTYISSGIAPSAISSTAPAGDVKLDATGNITLSESTIFNLVAAGGIGKGGNIEITTTNLAVINGAKLNASTFGQGDAGSIKITATGDIFFDGRKDGSSSGAGSVVGQEGIGKGGNIEITTGNLAVTNGAALFATTGGQGDVGSIKIAATGYTLFDGLSVASSTVGEGAVGKGGEIEITTGNLAVTNSAFLIVSTFGQGDAGKIGIKATGDTLFDGGNAYSFVAEGAVGKGGNIEITAGNLVVTNGALLSASTGGQGDAGSIKIAATGDIWFNGGTASSTVEEGAVGKGGNIEIATGNLFVSNAAQLVANTFGEGDAGSIKITATGDIWFDGIKNGASSAARSEVEQGAVGKGGNIEIFTRNLTVTDAALLTAATLGQGDAGNIKIVATGDILFDGRKDGFGSGAGSAVLPEAVGKGGNIEIFTRNLAVTDGALLENSTFGQGNAGNVKITATGDVLFDGSKDGFSSGIFSAVYGTSQGEVRKGGEIEINAGNLTISNGGALSTGSLFGQGESGNIVLNIGKLTLNNSVIIESISLTNKGGDINITAQDYLLLGNKSSIATDSLGSDADGNGGNIIINSPLIVATPGNNDITANADVGNGGRVNITSQGLFGIQYRPKGRESEFTNDITSSSTFGQDGIVTIDTPGTDPGRDTTELPNTTTDASNQISQTCSATTRENKLSVAGRGGLPSNADEPLTTDVIWQDPRASNNQPVASNAPTNQLPPPAVGMVFDGKGKVKLVAAKVQGVQAGQQVGCQQEVRK